MTPKFSNLPILEEDCTKEFNPEKILLAAILERANRDLESLVLSDNLDAIRWFLTYEKDEKDTAFSFRYVAEELNLGYLEICYLLNLTKKTLSDLHTHTPLKKMRRALYGVKRRRRIE